LIQGPTFMPRQAVRAGLAPGAHEAIGPAKSTEFIGALGLGAVSAHELGDRHTALELDSVDRHDHGS
jgi:hypothetical protein